MAARTAQIKLTVELDDDSLPSSIQWQASEAQHEGARPCQSMMLSLWDGQSKTTAAIDLWTKDTTVADMNLYFCQVFQRMAETYLRATKNTDAADQIRAFGDKFASTIGMR